MKRADTESHSAQQHGSSDPGGHCGTQSGGERGRKGGGGAGGGGMKIEELRVTGVWLTGDRGVAYW
jgi:hypothetical protein